MGVRYRATFDKKGLLAEFEDGECVWLRPDYAPPERSDLAAPQLIRDHHEPFRSMADGKVYDSKSAYRATLKARGLVEVGNDAMTAPAIKPPDQSARRKLLHRQLADVSDRQANKALKALKKQYST